MIPANYRGRFAPSPTGPLHFGSLVAAVGSYLDARHHGGVWLVRIEDIDSYRCIKAAANDILRTLAGFGLVSDEPVLYQSHHTAAYEAALHTLIDLNIAYPCCCTRREIADSALHGIDGVIYPGNCRNGIPPSRDARSWRVRTDLPSGRISFEDALQGNIHQQLMSDIGDFVIKRADNLFAYQLAVVVDDAAQGITDVVRGADLIHSTPRQIFLQTQLGLPVPRYMHLPVAVNSQGEKLGKQTLAHAVTPNTATLFEVLNFLRQQPPIELRTGTIPSLLTWAMANWHPERLKGCRQLPERAQAS